jgi:2-hydroxychromene-2-carboxylate isomerase
MSTKKVELYWDVGSTNTYFAIKLIKPILERNNAELVLHPFNLGYFFKSQNYELMKESKAKLRNRKQDLMRWAAKYNLLFSIPRQFPIKSSRVLRSSLVMRRYSLEMPFVEKILDRYWEQGDASISEYEGILSTVLELGIDPDKFEVLCESDEISEELVKSTNEGIARDVFGVPMIIVNDQLFWGKDRMEFVEDELRKIGA